MFGFRNIAARVELLFVTSFLDSLGCGTTAVFGTEPSMPTILKLEVFPWLVFGKADLAEVFRGAFEDFGSV